MTDALLRSVEELSESDIAAWRELSEQAVELNPFLGPDFVLTAAEALSPRNLGVLAAKQGSEWLACLPVTRIRNWRRVPLRGLVTWRHLYCFLGTPLVRREGLDSAVRELVAEGVRASGSFLAFDLLGLDGPVNSAIAAATSALGFKPVELDGFARAALQRREDPGGYLALSAKHRRNFERLRRRLEDDLGDQLTLRDRTQDPSAPEDFLRLEASGWKGPAGTGTAFESIGHRELFLRLCERMRNRGALELVSVEAAGRVAAMLCSFTAGDTVYTFKIGVEHELAEYSPGIQLLTLYIEHFHSSRFDRVDSCAEPTNTMINRLWADRREVCIRAIPGSAIKGSLGRPALEGIAWLRQRRR